MGVPQRCSERRSPHSDPRGPALLLQASRLAQEVEPNAQVRHIDSFLHCSRYDLRALTPTLLSRRRTNESVLIQPGCIEGAAVDHATTARVGLVGALACLDV